jgi:hypothetical protein
MALVKYQNMASVSGSQGGTTFSRNSYGSYIRSRVVPANPNTSAQQTVRSNMAASSAAWRSLSAAVRAVWAGFAETYSWSNALGEVGKLKPNALYCGFKDLVALSGLAVTLDQPDPAVVIAPGYSAGVTGSTGVVIIAWSTATNTYLTGAPGAKVALVYASLGARPSRTSDLPKTLRFRKVQPSVASVGPVSTSYTLPAMPAGSVVRISVVLVQSTATGIARSQSIKMDIVAA